MKTKMWMSRDADGIGGIGFSKDEPHLNDDDQCFYGGNELTGFCEDKFKRIFRSFGGLRKGQKKQVVVTIEEPS